MQFLIAGVVPAKIIRSDPRNAVCLFKEITAGIKRSGDGGGREGKCMYRCCVREIDALPFRCG